MGVPLYFVFLDEFGHIGPFVSRADEAHNTSPVFGVSGFLLPEREVRGFATWFYQLKKSAFAEDIAASKKHASTWEKKGHSLFTAGRAYKTKRFGYSLINQIKNRSGKLFFHGVEKHQDADASNPTGLYYTVLKHAIRDLERFFAAKSENYLIILDEHQSRAILLESAIKAMFAQDYNDRAKRLLEPPYQVESHLYQTIQAADWISAIVGPLWTYRCNPDQFADREWSERFFAKRLEAATTHSKLTRSARPRQSRLRGI